MVYPVASQKTAKINRGASSFAWDSFFPPTPIFDTSPLEPELDIRFV
jgi:hypothetical protein